MLVIYNMRNFSLKNENWNWNAQILNLTLHATKYNFVHLLYEWRQQLASIQLPATNGVLDFSTPLANYYD